MRTTQSMLSSNMLRNLNYSYQKMGLLQEHMTSGRKVNRPSENPIVAIKGMAYRVDIDRTKQYKENIGSANNWLDTTDTALDQVGDVLNRVKELLVQGANDSNTVDDRNKMKQEILQIRQHMKDVANTQVGAKYIFSGTHTDQPLYNADGTANASLTPVGANKKIEIGVFEAVKIDVNTPGQQLFANIDTVLGKIETALNSSNGEDVGNILGNLASSGVADTLSDIQNEVLKYRADVGARQNRVDLMERRLEMHEINLTKQLSVNEDTDYAATITEMVTHESIHQASLSIGARIIQQTLADFIR